MTQVMVVVASRHGATRGIADRLVETLRAEGLEVSVFDAKVAPGPQWADAVVIGGAAYMGKWLDEVTEYISLHRAALGERPTWLFASGPVGHEVVDKKGRDLLEPPKFLTTAAADVHAQGIRVFFGRWDPSDPPTNLAERLFRMVPVSKELMPIGDFRDWPAIEGWAREIARELAAEPVATG
jgi:menaquinone-dependent protoporphyrinogen oxidase